MLKKLLKSKPNDQAIGEWSRSTGKPAPKIAAILASASGGSHFFLHKIHGHPQILALKEHTLSGELKAFFNSKSFRVQDLLDNQLLPPKNSLDNVQVVALNKPFIEQVTYHFPFERQNIHLIQLVRNPISLFFSWKKGWDEMAGRDYQRNNADFSVSLDWLDRHILSEISNFSHWQNPQLDMVFNLESLSSRLDENLSEAFSRLGLLLYKDSRLVKLSNCVDCGATLVSRVVPQSGGAAALVCPNCGRVYLGAGGFNYIRSSTSADLANWKSRPEAQMLFEHFGALLGKEYMEYFANELYLQPDSHKEFSRLYSRLLQKG